MNMTHRVAGAVLVGIFLLAILTQPAHGATSMLIGVYYGNQGWKLEQVSAMENWQGKKMAVLNMFTNWDSNNKTVSNLFDQQLPNIWNNGNVPLVTWEPTTGATTPADIEVRIARGDYDSYIRTWSSKMKLFLSGPDTMYGNGDDRRAYLRLGHEMNGDWYPWGAAQGANTPADYIAMWQHVKGIFSASGIDATRLQWIWCANNADVGGFTAESYYPGDQFVDWVAVDGYNWGTSQTWSTWTTPAETYGPMITRLRALTSKPLAITEFASTTAPQGVSGKSTWIGDTMNYFASQNVKMVAWFNEDKETDWAVFGGTGGDGTFKYGRTTYKTYSAYKTAIITHGISSDTTQPRLITDAQFAGQ
jgi:beta-mannanase